jgi:hypothetical protein
MTRFCLTTHQIWGRVMSRHLTTLGTAYADDAYLMGQIQPTLQALADTVRSFSQDADLEVCLAKCKIYMPGIQIERAQNLIRACGQARAHHSSLTSEGCSPVSGGRTIRLCSSRSWPEADRTRWGPFWEAVFTHQNAAHGIVAVQSPKRCLRGKCLHGWGEADMKEWAVLGSGPRGAPKLPPRYRSAGFSLPLSAGVGPQRPTRRLTHSTIVQSEHLEETSVCDTNFESNTLICFQKTMYFA